MSIRQKIPFYDSLTIPYHIGKAALFGATKGFPGRKMKVIGVTGTNGKTTTSFMVWKMLNNAGRKAGVMTTVGWGGDEIHAPTDCAEGYSSVERGYDSEGRLISENFKDRYNKRANNKDGVASWNGYYDSEGNLVVTSRFDKDLNPLPIN
mgnify:CR=1 FL=1